MRWKNVCFGVLLAVAAACGGSYGPSSPPPPPPPPPGPPPPPPPPSPTNQINVNDSFFDPANATVTPGTAVTWTWRGGTGHNVTFEDGNSGSATQASGSHQRNFPTAGTFRYRCTVHSVNFDGGMTGRIVVQ